MPWNEPGGNNKPNDPWGGKKEEGPPALDKILNDFLKKLHRGLRGNKGGTWQPSNSQSTGFMVSILLVVILIIWFLSGFYIVNPAEEAVILRLGKYYNTMRPGLHWHARFIDTKYLVDVKKIYSFSIQGDFLTKSSEQTDVASQYVPVDTSKKADYSSDQSKNLVNVELNVQYRIDDPRAFLFNVVDPDATIKSVASGALSDMVGQMKLDEVLTTGRENLSSGVGERIKKVIDPYHTGFVVLAVTLRKVQAPDQVRAAFNDVNRADQDKATYIQQAQAYASKVVPLAQGMAARTLADAIGYQQKVVLTAEANIAKYEALLKVYTTSPEVTRQRMYFDTMQSILQKTSKMLIDVNSNNLVYLPLDKFIHRENVKVLPNDISMNGQSGLINHPATEEVKNDTN